MQIELQQIGKRFGRQWLFQNVSALLQNGSTYALTGNNGSGKSTLLQLIYGYQTCTKGKVLVTAQGHSIHPDTLYKQSGYVAPYLDLPEELTLEEQLRFHFSFKPLIKGMTLGDVMEAIWLTDSREKKIKHFSSGMKQRVKLAQAFFADVPVLFFDEPCTNLDEKGINWYRQQLIQLKQNRLIVIASNQLFEYDFADQVIRVGE